MPREDETDVPARESAAPGVLVVGLGNPLMGDDGVGVYAAGRLDASGRLHEGWRVEDCGTDVFLVAARYGGEDVVLVIDAINGDGSAGEVYSFGLEELSGSAYRSRSAHEISVIEALLVMHHADTALAKAQFHILGIQPAGEPRRGDMSPEVKSAADRLVERLLRDPYWFRT